MTKKVAALVLAAGCSRRMKMPKLFIEFSGSPLISWCLRAIQKVPFDSRILILGDRYQDALFSLSLMEESRGIDIIINHDFRQGMATSIKAGLSAISPDTEAILIVLSDMPFITSETMEKILYAFQESNQIILPVYQGNQGHPVLIPRFYFPQIEKLEGDKGAREILQRNKEKILALSSPTPEVILDIDTKEEWLKWKNSLL